MGGVGRVEEGGTKTVDRLLLALEVPTLCLFLHRHPSSQRGQTSTSNRGIRFIPERWIYGPGGGSASP